MRAAVVILALAGLAACHLASDPSISCAEGQHVEMGRCKTDDPVGDTIAITACNTVSPASITLKKDGAFRFANNDKVDHVVRGSDGQVWTTVKAATFSDYVGLTKAGSWQYDIDSCPKVGTVVVE